MVIVMLIVFLGNVLVLWVVKWNLCLCIMLNYYIMVLVLIDVFMLFFVMLLFLSVLIVGCWFYSVVLCLYYGYIVIMLGLVLFFILILIFVNCYFKVVWFNLYREYFKVKLVLIFLLFVWLVVFVWLFYFLLKGNFCYYLGKFCCIYDFDDVSVVEGFVLNMIFVLFMFSIIFFSYFRIFLIIWKYKVNLNNRFNNFLRIFVKDLNVIRFLFIVVVFYVLCWFLVLIVDIIELFIGKYSFFC